MSDESDLDQPTSSESSENKVTREPLSRRRFFETTLCGAVLAGTAVFPGWGAVEAAGRGEYTYGRGGKISKAAAHYQLHPHRSQHCGICEHFRPPGSCEIVAGRIVPNGWCRHFEARRGRSHGGPRRRGY